MRRTGVILLGVSILLLLAFAPLGSRLPVSAAADRKLDADKIGQAAGTKAATTPDGVVRIPLNESSDPKSQINEYLDQYHGEGIQHIALGTDDIYQTVETLRAKSVPFQTVPDTYYEQVEKRLPGHGEDVARLAADRILIDGAPTQGGGLLLQIFTQTVIGPIFFEIIQRRGNEGFGEGNFRALFESIELDQIRRGVLKE